MPSLVCCPTLQVRAGGFLELTQLLMFMYQRLSALVCCALISSASLSFLSSPEPSALKVKVCLSRRPVLVGTNNVGESERVAAVMRRMFGGVGQVRLRASVQVQHVHYSRSIERKRERGRGRGRGIFKCNNLCMCDAQQQSLLLRVCLHDGCFLFPWQECRGVSYARRTAAVQVLNARPDKVRAGWIEMEQGWIEEV